VLTPHEGEFARLFEGVLHTDPSFAALPTRHQRSKVERARAAARIVNGTIVLKGIDTVVADQTGQACIALNGGPELATAGSGDVLAGIIASHLAMGLPPFAAAAAGVWLHAETGRSLGYGLTADDLAAGVRPLLRRGRISMPRHGV
jgi:NAD(P)H-hydrate epimerase